MRQLQSLCGSCNPCSAACVRQLQPLFRTPVLGSNMGFDMAAHGNRPRKQQLRLHNTLVTRPEHSFGLCHALLQLYSPSRSLRLSDTPSLLEEVKQNVEGYGKLVLPSLVDMEDLAPDTGAICQKARFDRRRSRKVMWRSREPGLPSCSLGLSLTTALPSLDPCSGLRRVCLVKMEHKHPLASLSRAVCTPMFRFFSIATLTSVE